MQADRERLIELFKGAESKVIEELNKHLELDEKEWMGIYADHLLANGVIVPPVEVGQTVYCVDDFTEVVEECKVYGFTVVNSKLSLLVDNGECKFITRKWHNTKEQAEQKLKELSDNAING